MKKTMLVLSLFLMTGVVNAADISAADRETASASNVKQRVVTFYAKSVGSMLGAFAVAASGSFSNIIYPNRISTFVGNYAGNDYVVGGAICLIGAYQLYQAMFGKIDNRPVMTQLVDAMIPTKPSFFQDKKGRWRDASGRFVKRRVAEEASKIPSGR